jgi:glycerate dehydrogenase
MKIVVLDGYTLNPGDLSWDELNRYGEFTVFARTASPETIARIGDAQIVFTNKTVIDRHILDACPTIKYIGVLATGYNVVDVHAARERGVIVTNVPNYGTAAVAQHAIALLLEITNRVGIHAQSVQVGEWAGSQDWCYWKQPLSELAGKTMGMIGFGRIGQQTARVAQALGMEAVVYTRTPAAEWETKTLRFVSFDELLAKADVISLHCPLTESTRGIINRNSISRMKDGVIILNTSRGPLIVEADLAEALNSGKVYAAGVDVVSEEPIRADNPLLRAKNCMITPHIAWAPKEARARLLKIAIDNLKSFLTDVPVNVVNR